MVNANKVLLPTAYLPPIVWCSACWNAETVVVEACENYQKGSARNRALVVGPNGIQRLSIPLVKGKHQQTDIRAVRIAYDEPWQRHHWRTIQTAYGNAPYFEHYGEGIRQFYNKPYTFLFDYNLAFLEFILIKTMGWKGTLSMSESFSQPSGNTLESSAMVRYPQVFEDKHGFVPNLSVLDLLFCCGKYGGEILEKTRPIP
jgi:hypothetical protein